MDYRVAGNEPLGECKWIPGTWVVVGQCCGADDFLWPKAKDPGVVIAEWLEQMKDDTTERLGEQKTVTSFAV